MESTEDRLPHGYTNVTARDGDSVVKRYTGPQVEERAEREALVLRAVAPVIPVPEVRHAGAGRLVMRHMPGVPGQELMRPESARRVLAACGRVLARIHAVPTEVLAFAGTAGPGAVLVHGDFGPQNVLLDADAHDVTAVVDWEWARLGRPVEDLAWCEWIVRTHHPDCAGALPHLYGGYGSGAPAWPLRRGAMLARIRELIAFCAAMDEPREAVAEWRRRLAVTAGWRV